MSPLETLISGSIERNEKLMAKLFLPRLLSAAIRAVKLIEHVVLSLNLSISVNIIIPMESTV